MNTSRKANVEKLHMQQKKQKKKQNRKHKMTLR